MKAILHLAVAVSLLGTTLLRAADTLAASKRIDELLAKGLRSHNIQPNHSDKRASGRRRKRKRPAICRAIGRRIGDAGGEQI